MPDALHCQHTTIIHSHNDNISPAHLSQGAVAWMVPESSALAVIIATVGTGLIPAIRRLDNSPQVESTRAR
ncbi:hypothetical protein [Kosakonia oryziphila]|uniref:hypothetical protein n=1 Tax=Kosakonia oryziphila TaxID=1005667 RepID=UPI001111A576|nr:hypothetical protein [Kosakonia oryziphila]